MKSYLKLLFSNKLYTFIEAAGLVASLAFVLLIGNYTFSQLSILHENPDYKQIYSVDIEDCPGMTYAFTDLVKERIPEVNASAAYSWQEIDIKVGGDWRICNVAGVNRDFFEIFPYYEIQSGSADVINSKSKVFVTRSFANANSLEEGMTIGLGSGNEPMTIAGIIDDFDGTLLKRADVVVPIAKIKELYGLSDFNNFGNILTFIRVDKGTDEAVLFGKTDALCKEVYDFYGSNFFKIVALDRIDSLYFRDFTSDTGMFAHGDKGSLRILILVGLLLFFAAIFNYLNRNIALTGRRAKELTPRRLLWASQGSLLLTFIAESVAFTAVCVALALVIAKGIAPTMNNLLNDPDIPIDVSFSWKHLLCYAMFSVVLGALAGLAPTVLASRFKPLDVVKGEFRSKSKMTFSKVFIIFQNALTVFMLALTFVMEGQYKTALNRPMNAKTDDIFQLWAIGLPGGNENLINSLEQLPCVKRIGVSRGDPGLSAGGQYSPTRDGEEIMYWLYNMTRPPSQCWRCRCSKTSVRRHSTPSGSATRRSKRPALTANITIYPKLSRSGRMVTNRSPAL